MFYTVSRCKTGITQCSEQFCLFIWNCINRSTGKSVRNFERKTILQNSTVSFLDSTSVKWNVYITDCPDRTWRVLAVSAEKSLLCDLCEPRPQVIILTGIDWMPGLDSWQGEWFFSVLPCPHPLTYSFM